MPIFLLTVAGTTESYTLSYTTLFRSVGRLPQGHAEDVAGDEHAAVDRRTRLGVGEVRQQQRVGQHRSEEHTSELQSHVNLVCRLLLEKKNLNGTFNTSITHA